MPKRLTKTQAFNRLRGNIALRRRVLAEFNKQREAEKLEAIDIDPEDWKSFWAFVLKYLPVVISILIAIL